MSQVSILPSERLPLLALVWEIGGELPHRQGQVWVSGQAACGGLGQEGDGEHFQMSAA